MKRFYYDSWVARVLLFFSYCEAITLGPVAFSKQREETVKQEYRNHEATHMRQWAEVTTVCTIILWLLAVTLGTSPWWGVAAPLAYYVWYGLEYLVRLCLTGDGQKAYRSVSFEQEAYDNQYDDSYNTDCGYFGWVKYMGRKYSIPMK